MRFFNTFGRTFQEFVPLENKKVFMYVCGLTPYDHAHIGHARTYIAFDMIKRYLIYRGFDVFHIQNITDVEDKLLRRAKESGKDPIKIAEKFHEEALRLFDKLNILRANIYPKVSEHIQDIISFIKKLIDRGYAYETSTGVYFDVSKFSDYGKLSGQNLDKIKKGARVFPDETKNDPADFALWKKERNGLLEFDSPWGVGRPGWHIECSVMSLKHSGWRTLDIHGGARDLIFPHHENEIAQSEAATGKKFCNYWLHTGFLTVRGEKMSKSLGNFITVKEVLDKFDPRAVRLFFAMTHYRSPIDYNEERILAAEETIKRISRTLSRLKDALHKKEKPNKRKEFLHRIVNELESKIFDAFENDFDTPKALSYFFDLIREINKELDNQEIDYLLLENVKNKIEDILFILGIEDIEKNRDLNIKLLIPILKKYSLNEESPEKAVAALINLRTEARKAKNFSLADEIRSELKKIGIILEDTPKGTVWHFNS